MTHTRITAIHPTTERIERWADALTSGDYVQGYGALTSTEGHCCWGVACKLAVDDGVMVARQNPDTPNYTEYAWKDDDGTTPDSVDTHWHGIMPPEDFYTWMGINPDAVVKDDSIHVLSTHLASMNDGGNTFTQIAAEIRRLLLPATDADADA
jgi:hypothetical protein